MRHREPSIRLDRQLLLSQFHRTDRTMDAERPRQQVPKIPFRVLIIGRANAGKTTILQRVCETTDSPVIYRRKGQGKEKVRGPNSLSAGLVLLPTRLNLTRQSKLVTTGPYFGCP